MTGTIKQYRSKLLFSLSLIMLLTVGMWALPGQPASADKLDCDHNAVIYCGAASVASLINKYNHGDGVNSAASIQHIYSNFGVSSADISSIGSSAASGTIDSSGNIYLNNQLVASAATTAGRLNQTSACGGSKAVSDQGTAFYTRAPCVSFDSSPLSAYIVMKNDVFQYAILKSCGNPVTATPKSTPQPSYTITKQVAIAGSNNFSQNVSAMAGGQVTYKVTVQSTGPADVEGLKVSDNLPSGETYLSGSLKRDGVSVSSDNFFSSGYTIASLKSGSSTDFSFQAMIGTSNTANSCQSQSLNNTASMTATSLPTETSSATVEEKCPAPPAPATVICNSLTDTPVSREAYGFTAKATAQNSSIKSYSFNFGDGSAPQSVTTANSVTTLQHQYTQPGTYTASVSVVSSGVNNPVTSSACQLSLTVAPAPGAECTNLVLNSSSTDEREVTANVSYQASNGASLQSISYDWGDGQTDTNTAETAINHSYAQDGDYSVKATLTFVGSGAVSPSTCQATVSVITAQPICNLLQISTPDSDGNVSVANFQSTDDGAVFTGADVDWGDGTTVSSVNPVIGQTHQYAMPIAGTSVTYDVVATAHFNVDNQDTTATSGGCSQQITLSTPVAATTSTPSAPTSSLINTGSGSVIAVFSLASGSGIWLYRRYLRKHILKG